MRTALILTLLLAGAIPAFAESLIGKPVASDRRRMSFNEALMNILEDDRFFFLLFTNHPAYYALPKTAAKSEQKSTLEALKQQKQSLAVAYDGVTLIIESIKY